VRVHALQTLGTGDPLLLRIEAGAPETRIEDGAVTVANPCLSGGSLEIFLEPRKPAPRLVVVGETPIANALVTLGNPLGFTVEAAGDPAGAAAVVVASLGRGEEPALEAALRAEVPYVGLVASPKRGSAVLASLDVTAEERERVHSPAGLDLGGRSAPEIALSILAEIVALRTKTNTNFIIYDVPAAAAGEDRPGRSADSPAGASERPSQSGQATRGPAPLPIVELATATDPICGMTVAITASALSATGADSTVAYFCCEGCRRQWIAEHG
jgi:xanthine dehydrogenase accessory factor